MFEPHIRLLLLTTILFSTQFSLDTFAMMNPDEDPSRKGISTRQSVCQLQNSNERNATCDACWEPLRKNAKKREILSHDGMRLLSVCKKCFNEDKEEQKEAEERYKEEAEFGAQNFAEWRESHKDFKIQFVPKVTKK